MSKPLWHGRFDDGPTAELLAYTSSLSFDRRLAPDDLAGSRAHVRGLRQADLIADDELQQILDGLSAVEAELDNGSFEFAPTDEDIHTAIERRLTELVGPVGGKLHTGRSRNDQVATDLRLWCQRSLAEVVEQLVSLMGVLGERATEAGAARVPGYTHLQRAQPILLAHHLLAHGWALARDVDRLQATIARLDVSPLGAGALAGTSLPIDPAFTAAELGFSRHFDNSLDAVSDRDFVAEALFDLALTGVHMSRLGEEIVLWASDEFGFLGLDDAWATGSSMMPQKKNPDIAELARGKTGRLIGNLTALLVALKGLPLTYNRDLQEDKEPLFDSVDQIRLGAAALAGLVATATFDVGAMAVAADSPYAAATDLADLLVRRGVPFREAHAVVGSLVRDALAGGPSLAEAAAAHPDLGEDAVALLEPGAVVDRHLAPVAEQLARYGELVETLR